MTDKKTQSEGVVKSAFRILKTAVIVTLLSALVSFAVNVIRPDGLPFFAEEDYEILVPCPEPGGEVFEISPNDAARSSEGTFIVDARSKSEYEAWHFEDATNLTFDYLDPVPKADLESLARAIANSRAKKVVVYGDGSVPDTGEQLGKELSGNGIKNVFFVKGGVTALKNAAKELR
jgi:rhodanese-related sulfurtransferase